MRLMRRFSILVLILTLVFASCFISGSISQSMSPTNQYSIALQGFVWDHTTLNALVVSSDNESWWNPSYVNICLRAVGQWNNAINAFASNYSDYSYMSNLRIQTTVSNVSLPGFDIYITWTQMPLSNTSDEIGLSQIFPNAQSVIINSTIALATHAFHGQPLDNVDMQNVALHELGHSLGLGHSNDSTDVMYAIYSLGNSPKAVSTLDAYGVATLFAWQTNSIDFYPVSDWLKTNSVMLPANIAYAGLPVSPQNASPQTLIDNPVVQFLILIGEILIHPEILAIIILIIAVMVIIVLVSGRRKRR
jgi:hypothetical protein